MKHPVFLSTIHPAGRSRAYFSRSRYIAASAAVLMLLCSCGRTAAPVSSTESTEEAVTEEETTCEIGAALTPVEGTEGLYYLTTSALGDYDFDEIAQLGDNLLLVKEDWSSGDAGFDEEEEGSDAWTEGEPVEDTEDAWSEGEPAEDASVDESDTWAEEDLSLGDLDEDAWYDEEDIVCRYTFTVYDPVSDRVLGTLSDPDYAVSSWQVIHDRLCLNDTNDALLHFYDEQLQEENVLDYSNFSGSSDLYLYPGTGDLCYCYDYDDSAVFALDLSDMSREMISGEYYNASPSCVSLDGRYLYMSGVSKKTLKESDIVYDTKLQKEILSAPAVSGFVESIDSTGSFYACNYALGVWTRTSADGNIIAFQADGLNHVFPLSDGSILAEEDQYDEEYTSHTAVWTRFAEDGTILGSFSYDCMGDTEYDCNFSTHTILLEKCDCIAFLTVPSYYQGSVSSSILIWKPEESSSPQTVESVYTRAPVRDVTEEDGVLRDGSDNIISLVPDPDSYDWGDLTDCRAKALSLSEQYGIEILFGPQIPEMIDCYHCVQENDPEVMAEALDKLETILSCYPDGFLDQLCCGSVKGIRVYLTGDLYGDSEGMITDPGGYVCDMSSYKGMVLDTAFRYDWDYTINHELGHMITTRLDLWSAYDSGAEYSTDGWMSRLPQDFDYLYSYDNYTDSEGYQEYPEYFMDSYGTTWLTEDAAELFGYAMELGIEDTFDWQGLLTDNGPASSRYSYYCLCIRSCFDTEGWSDVTMWEKILQ